ncbi:hypothetical protein VCHC57A1_3025, partial [Vibrio cholerae HC-57A1]
MLLSQP